MDFPNIGSRLSTRKFSFSRSPVSVPDVTITATDPSASESGLNAGTFTLTRTGSTASALTVSLSMSGSATNGADYTSIPLIKTIPIGQTSANIILTPIDDALVEGPETAILTVAAGSSYSVGSPSSATVMIADNDGGDVTPPTVSITSPPNGSTLPGNGPITISATASDTSGIASIRLFINPLTNPTPIQTCFNTNSCSTNVNAHSNLWVSGPNIIRAEATDTAPIPNLGSATITVYHS